MLYKNKYIIKKEKIGLLLILQNIIVYFLAVSSIFSPIRVLPNYNQIMSILIVFWFIFVFLDNQKFILSPSNHQLAIYIFILYTTIVPYLMGNAVIGNRFWGLAQIPLFYLAYQKNMLGGNQKLNYKIIIGVIPFVIMTSLITLKAYSLNPLISRQIKTTVRGYEYMQQGIGGYGFIYFLVICLGILLYIVFNKENELSRKYKILGFLLIALFSINIILSNFSTALYLLLLIFMIRIFIPNIIEKSKILIIVFFILLFIPLTQMFSEQILDLLIDYSGNSLNTSRLMEIKDYIITNRIDASIWGRLTVWKESLSVFLENPIIGIIKKRILFVGWGLEGFGQHSQILDTFALFGLVIGLLQLYIFIKPFTLRLKKKKDYFGLSILLLVITMILLTFNNATPSIGFAAFFIYPSVFDWCKKTY